MTSGARVFGAGRFAGVAHLPGGKRKAPVPAQPISPYRRRLLAMVHLAPTQLGLSVDDYRKTLFDVAGVRSAKEATDAKLALVVEHFKARGFEPVQIRKPGAAQPADHPSARKARALWLSLYELGAIENPADQALEAFARRQLGCTRLQWADQGQMDGLIEALKKMAEREGWDHSLKDVPRSAGPIVLKRRLVEAIMERLRAADEIPDTWDFSRAAFAFAGMNITLLTATGSELDIVARELGRVLRETKGAI